MSRRYIGVFIVMIVSIVNGWVSNIANIDELMFPKQLHYWLNGNRPPLSFSRGRCLNTLSMTIPNKVLILAESKALKRSLGWTWGE